MAVEIMNQNLDKFLYYMEIARAEVYRTRLDEVKDRLYYVGIAIESCQNNIEAIQKVIAGEKEKIRLEEIN